MGQLSYRELLVAGMGSDLIYQGANAGPGAFPTTQEIANLQLSTPTAWTSEDERLKREAEEAAYNQAWYAKKAAEQQAAEAKAAAVSASSTAVMKSDLDAFKAFRAAETQTPEYQARLAALRAGSESTSGSTVTTSQGYKVETYKPGIATAVAVQALAQRHERDRQRAADVLNRPAASIGFAEKALPVVAGTTGVLVGLALVKWVWEQFSE